MLKSLHIKNYVLIDSLDVEFPEGLVIITGQTGAGKSIILGALSLLMGAKSDASAIMSGEESCVVEAEFEISDRAGEICSLMEENDVEWDGSSLIVRRVIHSSGRSRSFVNDCPVQVSFLTAISSRLVDIHSQHQSLLLSDRNFQLEVLDDYAGNSDLLAECRRSYTRLNSLNGELSDIRAKLARAVAEREYDESQYRQLEAAKLTDGELEDLESEQKQLSNSEEIKSEVYQVESLDLLSSLKEAERSFQKLSKFIPSCDSLFRRLESCRIEVGDILDDLADVNSKVDMSPDRLQVVEDRLSMIYELMRRHNCSGIPELLSIKADLESKLYGSEEMEEKSQALTRDIAEETSRLMNLSKSLHTRRAEAAPILSEAIQTSLRYLELDRAVFEIELEETPVSSCGTDKVSFNFSSNGTNPVNVSKCASGGEISRIMLCLKSIMARFTQMPTMIFDEIDTGVSGSVADKMGSMICDMGSYMQVFAITHLPQVAAKGSAHYLVSKDSGERTVSSIKKLSAEQRVLEVARMLSGSTVTSEAIANARSLLGNHID